MATWIHVPLSAPEEYYRGKQIDPVEDDDEGAGGREPRENNRLADVARQRPPGSNHTCHRHVIVIVMPGAAPRHFSIPA